MTELVDSHVHLDDPRFDGDREQVIARARERGVRALVVPAVDTASWQRILRLRELHDDVFPAYGLHPMFLAHHRAQDVDALDQWLDIHASVAVGEIGLDHFVEGIDHATQLRFFDRQLAIARNHRLPVILHARRAVDAVIAALRRHRGVTGVVHSFSGSAEQAARLMDAGFMVGIGGPATYPRAQRLRRLVAGLPIDQLLIESDGPDQPGVDHRGQRNEPAWVADTLEHLAGIRQTGRDALARATTANAERLFGLGSFRN